MNCCASCAAVTIFGGGASTSIGRGKVGVSASAAAQLRSNGYQVEGKDPFIAAGFRPRWEGGECAVVGSWGDVDLYKLVWMVGYF